ncbi:MAG: oxidase [Armatimonadetes bacterium]|nr:oxidase [Armatimonadota bacterium]
MAHGHDAHAGHGHGHDTHDHGHDAHGGGGHPTLAQYNMVFWILMGLLVLTLGAAYFDLGRLNLPIAMVIAIVKAGFVIAFFMHLKFSTRLVQLFGLLAFGWLVIMFVLTLMDYLSRGMMK